jgi:hypothetical protein
LPTRPSRVPAFLGPAFLGPAFLGPAFLGPAFLGPAFLGPAFLGPAFIGSAVGGRIFKRSQGCPAHSTCRPPIENGRESTEVCGAVISMDVRIRGLTCLLTGQSGGILSPRKNKIKCTL